MKQQKGKSVDRPIDLLDSRLKLLEEGGVNTKKRDEHHVNDLKNLMQKSNNEDIMKKRTFAELCDILKSDKSNEWKELKKGLFSNYTKMLDYKEEMYLKMMQENDANIHRQMEESVETARALFTDDITGKISVKVNKEDIRYMINDVRDKHYTLVAEIANRRRIQTFFKQIKVRKEMNKLDSFEKNIYNSIVEAAIAIAGLIGEARRNVRDEIANLIFIMSNNVDIFTKSFVNICITGSAGTGKTTISNVISTVFDKCGFLLNAGSSRIISPKDLTGSYLGESGKKTAKQLTDSLESVIFIDEAYGIMACMDNDAQTQCKETKRNGEDRSFSFALKGGGKRRSSVNSSSSSRFLAKKSRKKIDPQASSFGYESITEFVNFLDKRMGLIVVVVAGYEDSMKNCFFAANEGLDRRFPIRIRLADYTSADLANILVRRLKELNPSKPQLFDDHNTIDDMCLLISEICDNVPKFFSNQAGDIINLATFISNYIASTTSFENSNKKENINKSSIFLSQIAAGFQDFASSKGIQLRDVFRDEDNVSEGLRKDKRKNI